MFDPTKPYQSNYADPFSSPLNPINATPGNWGVDPMYLTPGYTANFRPQYAGPQGSMAPGNMGFWEGVGRGGLGGIPDFSNQNPHYYNNDVYSSAIMNSTSLGGIDAGMGFNQNIVAPMAAFYFGEKLTSGKVNAYRDLTMMASEKWNYAFGQAGTPGKRAWSSAVGAKFGRGVMGGMAGFGGQLAGVGASAGRASMMGQAFTGLGSMAGGIAGRMAVPLAAGHAIMGAMDHAIFDPYVAIREGQNALMQNFSNQYISDGGSRVTGFGMSRERAAKISSSFAKDSARDLAFEVGDYGKIADYAGRAGLFNDMADFDVETMKKRVKGIASQVKMVMSIANEPSLQEAVQMIAKLKTAGATDVGGFASTVLRNIGNNAATSGISAMEMMNTVGATGQYMYQSQGLTPFIGMSRASDIHAGFTSAFRNGLIDPAALARMGGVAGATQAAMSGEVTLARSNFNMMDLANQHIFGGSAGSSITGTIGAFGANMSRNPVSTMGYMKLFGNDMVSKQLQDDPTSTQNQIFQRMRQLGLGNDAGSFASVASSFGMQDDQIRAMMEQMRGANDSKTMRYRLGSAQGQAKRQRMNIIEQHNLDYGDSWLAAPIHGFRNVSSQVSSRGVDMMEGVTGFFGGVGDSMEEYFHELKYGVRAKDMKVTDDMLDLDRIISRRTRGAKAKGFDLSRFSEVTSRSNMMNSKVFGDRSLRGMTASGVGVEERYSDLLASLNDHETLGGEFYDALSAGNGEELSRLISIMPADILNKMKGVGGNNAHKRKKLLADIGRLKPLLTDNINGPTGVGVMGTVESMLENTLGPNVKGGIGDKMSLINKLRGHFKGAGSLDGMAAYLSGGAGNRDGFSSQGKELQALLINSGLVGSGEFNGLDNDEAKDLITSTLDSTLSKAHRSKAYFYSAVVGGGEDKLNAMVMRQLTPDQKAKLANLSPEARKKALTELRLTMAVDKGIIPKVGMDADISGKGLANRGSSLKDLLGTSDALISTNAKALSEAETASRLEFGTYEEILSTTALIMKEAGDNMLEASRNNLNAKDAPAKKKDFIEVYTQSSWFGSNIDTVSE